jgi:hypothetical protein
MAKKVMKKFSPSLTIMEMQIKTTLRFYLTLSEELPSRTQRKTTHFHKDVEKRNLHRQLVGT